MMGPSTTRSPSPRPPIPRKLFTLMQQLVGYTVAGWYGYCAFCRSGADFRCPSRVAPICLTVRSVPGNTASGGLHPRLMERSRRLIRDSPVAMFIARPA